MASLPDRLNQQIFHIDIQTFTDSVIYASLRFTRQKTEFDGKKAGWVTVIEKEFFWHDFELSRKTLFEFKHAVQQWTSLPLEQIGRTYFSGTWDFCDSETGKCRMTLGPCPDTPSKTDWFLVRLTIVSGKNRRTETIRTDRTCLLNFANEIPS